MEQKRTLSSWISARRYIRDFAADYAARHGENAAEIEEQGALVEEEIDQEPGVAKRRVDELKGESRAHAGWNVGYTHYRRLASLRADAVTDLVRAGTRGSCRVLRCRQRW